MKRSRASLYSLFNYLSFSLLFLLLFYSLFSILCLFNHKYCTRAFKRRSFIGFFSRRVKMGYIILIESLTASVMKRILGQFPLPFSYRIVKLTSREYAISVSTLYTVFRPSITCMHDFAQTASFVFSNL